MKKMLLQNTGFNTTLYFTFHVSITVYPKKRKSWRYKKFQILQDILLSDFGLPVILSSKNLHLACIETFLSLQESKDHLFKMSKLL